MKDREQPSIEEVVSSGVQKYFHEDDLNCATTALRIYLEFFDMPIEQQVLDAALVMHGAGGYRAQCGIVEGALMFIGIIGRNRSIDNGRTVEFAKEFASSFEDQFGSLSCRVLRPGGFNDDDPPHLCEELTVNGIVHGLAHIGNWLENEEKR